jgi:hypothetical protein
LIKPSRTGRTARAGVSSVFWLLSVVMAVLPDRGLLPITCSGEGRWLAEEGPFSPVFSDALRPERRIRRGKRSGDSFPGTKVR